MSSCSSCSNSAAQAYKPQTAQSYVQQQLAAIQKPAQNETSSAASALNAAGDRGRVLNITA
jgi:hypothetical protein